MKNAIKKAISILLVAVMVFGVAPLAGFVGLDLPELNLFAPKAEAASSGTCGDNLTWTFNESTGELVISGTGNMNNYHRIFQEDGPSLTGAPWGKYFLTIKSVTIGNGVTTIGAVAFFGCTSLASITISDTVTTIGSSAFENCKSLENVIIGNEVTSIGFDAFRNCDNLINIMIPDSVTNIGSYSFRDCDSLTNIKVDSNNTVYSSDKYGVLFNKDKTELIQYPMGNTRTSYIIPNSVISIHDNAFSECDSLISVSIGNSVTNIGHYAFYGCDSLTCVSIGSSLTIRGDFLFDYCNSLTSITVDSANTVYSSDEYGVLFNKDKTELIQYPVGNTRTSYIIPDTVTSIRNGAFSECESIINITISNSVTRIGYVAFSRCSYISNVYYAGSKSDWEIIEIEGGNEPLTSARIHYNSAGSSGGSTETPDNTPKYDSSLADTMLMPTPSQTTISYGDSIILHVDPSKIPEGGYAEWYPSNGNFSYSVSADGTTCTITPEKSGNTKFTALIYDAEGNIVSADEQIMTSKAGLFDKIIAFFKKLFGATKIIPQGFKFIF